MPKKSTSKTPSAPAVDRAAHGSQLVVVPLDTAPESLAEMRAAGYVPIMTDSPEKVKVLMPGNHVVGGDLLMAAMAGLMDSAGDASHTGLVMRNAALTELHSRLKAHEAETANR